MAACIGNAFMPGVKEAIDTALETYRAMGARGDLAVLPNLTVLPPLGLGAMHNFLIQKACLSGYDYVLLLHNDVLLQPDTIVRLVAHGKGYLVPFFDQSPLGRVHKLAEPMLDSGQGLHRLEWSVPYCALLDTGVMRLVGYRPFSSSLVYCEDEYDSMYFRLNGVNIWQDTDTQVKLLRGPGLLCDAVKERKVLKPFENP